MNCRWNHLLGLGTLLSFALTEGLAHNDKRTKGVLLHNVFLLFHSMAISSIFSFLVLSFLVIVFLLLHNSGSLQSNVMQVFQQLTQGLRPKHLDRLVARGTSILTGSESLYDGHGLERRISISIDHGKTWVGINISRLCLDQQITNVRRSPLVVLCISRSSDPNLWATVDSAKNIGSVFDPGGYPAQVAPEAWRCLSNSETFFFQKTSESSWET